MHPRISILGVPIDVLSRSEVVGTLVRFTQEEKQHHVMTPNPEMLVLASKYPAFKALLQKTSLNLPDGTGLLYAARYVGGKIPERVTGTDTMIDLCAREGIGSVFFLGAAEGVAETVARSLQQKFPTLVIAGTFAGSPEPQQEAALIDRINASGASVLFVAYGAPLQDVWIDRVLPKMPSVKLAMGVGGAFDFVAGVQKRAPSWVQSIGLEWLWRLLLEPRRWQRIITAVLVFPFLLLRYRHRL